MTANSEWGIAINRTKNLSTRDYINLKLPMYFFFLLVLQNLEKKNSIKILFNKGMQNADL